MLPGMDGGASLSREFRSELEVDHEVVAVEYPPTEPWGYRRAEEHVRGVLEARGAVPTALVAESYSGPVAIRIGAAPPACLRRLVLVATFVTPPVWSPVVRSLGPLLARLRPPAFAVRRLMVGPDAPRRLVDEVRAATALPSPATMRRRFRELASIDERARLASLEVPALLLRAARDRLVPARCAPSHHAPSLPLVEIDGPHLLLGARPAEAARAIREHLGAP